MQFIELKGARVPALGFGTWQLTGDTCVEMVQHALAVGYRHIDTAQMYNNEAEVGTALQASPVPRDEIFLTTKIWYENLNPVEVRRVADESLRKLQTDYVDLLLIHWPNPSVSLADTLSAMMALQDEGKTRHIGVSNFPVALLEEALEGSYARLICDQVEYHPYLNQGPVLAFLRNHDMMLTAYSPLGKGETAKDATLQAIGEKYGKTSAQVVLRWLLDQNRVAAIPRTSNKQRCQQNFEIFDFQLSEEHTRAIDALQGDRRLINPSWAPAWDPA